MHEVAVEFLEISRRQRPYEAATTEDSGAKRKSDGTGRYTGLRNCERTGYFGSR